MKKVLAFGASNSSSSINRKLAAYAGSQLSSAEVTVVDLNDFEMPIYGIDKEKQDGVPELAHRFIELILAHDGIIISMSEHNGAYSVAFKNIMDWISRIDKRFFGNKPMLLMSTSPGGRGGKNVFELANRSFPHMGAEIAGTFSMPRFYEKFSSGEGITDPEYAKVFREQLKSFEEALADETVKAV